MYPNFVVNEINRISWSVEKDLPKFSIIKRCEFYPFNDNISSKSNHSFVPLPKIKNILIDDRGLPYIPTK